MRGKGEGAKENISTRRFDLIKYLEAEIVDGIYARKDVNGELNQMVTMRIYYGNFS